MAGVWTAQACARARAVTATASGRGIGSAPALHPGNAAPLDRDRLPGYIFSRSGGQAARALCPVSELCHHSAINFRNGTRLCGGDLDSTGVERRWLRVEVP